MTFEQFNRKFRPNRTDADWLSRDPDQVDRYIADPLCGFDCTVGLWWDFIGGMLRLSPSAFRKDLPVHLFSGTADAVGEMGHGVRRHFQAIREAGAEKVTLRLFEGGRHEMLNETNRDEVWDYLLALCLASESPLKSEHPAMSPQTLAIND
jgi:alpha-beta hydrolase superfamily lysophospholipase